MRHAILTCKNHPNLRWSCKSIAVNPSGNDGRGSYNGTRNIFFGGEPTGAGFYPDGSGIHTATYICDKGQPRIVQECSCPATDLILAPEDSRVFED